MKRKFIFIFLTLWLVGFFLLEIIEFVSSLSTNTITIPFCSFIGFISWIGLILRKRWGCFCFSLYLLLLIFYAIQDVYYQINIIYSIVVLIVLISIRFLLNGYLQKENGLVWQ